MINLQRLQIPVGLLLFGDDKPPYFTDLIQWACGDPVTVDGEQYIIDKKGDSGVQENRVGVPFTYLDGNNNRHLNVPSITDADLPTNYEILWEGVYSFSAATRGLFGFNAGGTNRYYVSSLSTEGSFRNGVYDPVQDVNTSLVDGDNLKVQITVTGNQSVLTINGVSNPSNNFTKEVSGFALQLLSNGEGIALSEHKCSLFTITNTDTNEELVRFEEWGNNNNPTVYDMSGNDNHGEIQNADGTDVVETTNGASDGDINGYTIARALGKNQVNKDNLSSISGFVKFSDGLIAVSSGFNASDYIIVEEDIEYSISGITMGYTGANAGWAAYDKDKNYIDGWNNQDSQVMPIGTKFVRCTIHDDDLATFQLEKGSTPTAYESWIGYYKDSALTQPISDGTRLPVITGTNLTTAYTADSTPNHAPSQFTGLLKGDKRVIDGVVDNGIDYENWVDLGPNVTVSKNGINFSSFVAGEQAVNNLLAVKPNTQYTIKYTFSNLDVGGSDRLFISSFGVANVSVNLDTSSGNGQKTKTFITDGVLTDKFLRLVTTGSGGNNIDITIDKVYETALGEPTSGAFEQGNSWIEATTRYDLVQASLLATTQLYNVDDLDNVFAVPVEITGNLEDNPLYVREDEPCILLYNRTLTVDENEEVDKYLGFSAPLLDGADGFLLDGADDKLRGTAL